MATSHCAALLTNCFMVYHALQQMHFTVHNILLVGKSWVGVALQHTDRQQGQGTSLWVLIGL